MTTVNYWAIVPAAGSGQRFGGEVAKQFQPLGDHLIAQHSLSRLLNIPCIARIIVPSDMASPYWLQIPAASDPRVELVAGGGQQVIGQLQIARFVNPSGLKPLGSNLLATTAASGQPQLLQPGVNGAGILNQGSLEASNVNVVEEMVNMIETQRAYEVNSKAISAADGMLRFLNNNL